MLGAKARSSSIGASSDPRGTIASGFWATTWPLKGFGEFHTQDFVGESAASEAFGVQRRSLHACIVGC